MTHQQLHRRQKHSRRRPPFPGHDSYAWLFLFKQTLNTCHVDSDHLLFRNSFIRCWAPFFSVHKPFIKRRSSFVNHVKTTKILKLKTCINTISRNIFRHKALLWISAPQDPYSWILGVMHILLMRAGKGEGRGGEGREEEGRRGRGPISEKGGCGREWKGKRKRKGGRRREPWWLVDTSHVLNPEKYPAVDAQPMERRWVSEVASLSWYAYVFLQRSCQLV